MLTARPSGVGSLTRTANPPPGRGPGAQLAAVQRGALAHADQPEPAVAARPAVARAAAVVDDLDLELVGPVAQVHVGARRPRVLERVGQRLLHDPVGRDVDRLRQRRARSPSTVSSTASSRVAHARRRAARAGATPGCGARLVLVARPGAGSPSRRCSSATACRLERLDRGQRLLRLGRIAVDHDARGAGLDAHHAHVVGDDVVQLARDPHALLEHRAPRVLLALALGLQGALLGRRGLRRALAQGEAGEPRDREQRRA